MDASKRKLVKVRLNKDHTHAGVEYAAGEEIEVTEKRREYFAERGWLADEKPRKAARTC